MSLGPAYECEIHVIRGRDPLVRAIFRPPTTLSLGTNPRASITLPDQGLPDHHDLLRLDFTAATLRFESDMIVEADLGAGPKKARELMTGGGAVEGPDGWALALPPSARGLVQFGELRFLWRVLAPRPGEARLARPGERPGCAECGTVVLGLTIAPTGIHPCPRCGTLNRSEGGPRSLELGATVGALPSVSAGAAAQPPTRKIGPMASLVSEPFASTPPLPQGPRTPMELEGLRTVPEIPTLARSSSAATLTAAPIDDDELPTPPRMPALPASVIRSAAAPVAPPSPTLPAPPGPPPPGPAVPSPAAPARPAAPASNSGLPLFEPLAGMRPTEAPKSRKRPADLPTFDGIATAPKAPQSDHLLGTGSPDAVPTPLVPPRASRPSSKPEFEPLPPPPGPNLAGKSNTDLPSRDAISTLREQGLSTRAAIHTLKGQTEVEEPPADQEGAAPAPERETSPPPDPGPARDPDEEPTLAPPPTARLDSLPEVADESPKPAAESPARVRKARAPEPPASVLPFVAVGLLCGLVGLALLYYAFVR